MPRIARELSAIEVKRINEPGAHAVGGVSGLLLVVKPSGARSWVLRTSLGGRRRDMGLGPFPEVSLADARHKASEAKDKFRMGVDPIAERRAARVELAAAEARRVTFKTAATRCHAAKAKEFRNVKHRADWISALERFAYPVIGNLDVDKVEIGHIVQILEPIWYERTETAMRLRGRIEAVLAWATVSGFRHGENPARWKGYLDAILPSPGKVSRVEHHAALPWPEIGAFMADLRKREGIGARALEFAILTAARSGEVRLATWNEIDLAERVWTVPANRMKAGREHRVPLSEWTLALLEAMPRMHGSSYVFPAPRGGALSDMSLSAVCRRMEVDAVPHGFRSTFRDWCAENTNYPREVAEMALAHSIGSAVEAAYRRGDLYEKRRRMMEEWARWCATVDQAAEVVTKQDHAS